MTMLPLQRVQCDRCLSVIVLAAKRSDHWGAELQAANWIARPTRVAPIAMLARYADEFLAEIDGRRDQ
jgi:hypothetical protein